MIIDAVLLLFGSMAALGLAQFAFGVLTGQPIGTWLLQRARLARAMLAAAASAVPAEVAVGDKRS